MSTDVVILDEENIIKQRVLANRDVSLKKLTKKFFQVADVYTNNNVNNASNVDSSKEDISTTRNKLMRQLMKEIDLCEFQFVNRHSLSYSASQQQNQHLEQMQKQKEGEILSLQQNIEDLKVELQRQKKLTQEKEEYELLIGEIKKLPSRKQTQQEIANVQQQISSFDSDIQATNSQFDLRTKQFQLFLYSLRQLQQTLQEEEIPVASTPIPSTNTIPTTQPEINDVVMKD